MTSNRKQTGNITQKGQDLLTLIRDAGFGGIGRKELIETLGKQLDEEDDTQLNLLASEGFIWSSMFTTCGLHTEITYQAIYEED